MLHRRSDRRHRYVLRVELGLVFSLALLVAAFRADLVVAPSPPPPSSGTEPFALEAPQITVQDDTPPPPPRPAILRAVPDDVLLDAEPTLDATIDLDGPFPATAPPVLEPSDAPDDEPVIFVPAEDMPVLIGGLDELMRQVRYPEVARRARIEGRVVVQFVVDRDGRVADAVVLREPGGGLGEEALRVIRLAKFKPGKQRGKPVRVKMSLPITFRLK